METTEPTPEMRLAAYIDWWLETHVAPRYAAKTLAAYRAASRVHIVPVLGEMPIGELTNRDVQAWIDSMVSAGRLSPATIEHASLTLSSALGYGVVCGYLAMNAATRLRRPPRGKTPMRTLDADEIARLRVAWADEWYGPLFETAVATGMRRGELIGLRWPNVGASEIMVCEQISDIRAAPVWHPTKGHRSRAIPLPAALGALLAAHREHIERTARRAGTRAWRPLDLVFPSRRGTPAQDGELTRILHRCARAAGVAPVPRLHEFRHTYATRMIDAGLPLVHVQKLLGHDSYQVTANIYVHLSESATRSARDAISDFLTPSE